MCRKNIAERQIQLLIVWVLQSSADASSFEEFRVELATKLHDPLVVLDMSDMASSVARVEEAALKAAMAHFRARLKTLKKERARFNRATQMQVCLL